LGDDNGDKYISFISDSVKIEAASGSNFKLESFNMNGFSNGNITITTSSGAVLNYTSNNMDITRFVDVSNNIRFENISSITFTGPSLNLNLDDLNFSEPVLSYNVTYNGNGSQSGSVTDSTLYHEGEYFTVSNGLQLIKTGYTLIGWNSSSDGSGTPYTINSNVQMGTSNITLYAMWSQNTYSLSYSGNGNTGGTVPSDTTNYHNGDTATVLNNTGTLAKSGYTFVGWNTLANGTGTTYSGGDTFSVGTSNITLYAKWEAIDYTVSYNGNGNTDGNVPIDGTLYNIGSNVEISTNSGALSKIGYEFYCWNTNSDGSGANYFELSNYTIETHNVILYAKWTPIDYFVTYDGNGNTEGEVPYDENVYHLNDVVTIYENVGALARTGHTFDRWYADEDGQIINYSYQATFIMGINNKVLYAKWIPIEYSFTYDGNGNTDGSVPIYNTIVHYLDQVNIVGNTGNLIREGYTLWGWNTKEDGTGDNYYEANSYTVGNENVILYARWIPQEYTITYDSNGSTSGLAPVNNNSYIIGDNIDLASNTGNLVKTGYTFDGWNTLADGTGTTYSDGDTFAVGTSNITLYAKWIKSTYTVTYEGNGNSGGTVPIDLLSYNSIDSITILNNEGNLSKAGYTFKGWNTIADGSGLGYYPNDQMIIGDNNITLYAQWRRNPAQAPIIPIIPPTNNDIIQIQVPEFESENDGVSTLSLSINEADLLKAIGDNSPDDLLNYTVNITINNTDSDVMNIQLPDLDTSGLVNKDFILSIDAGDIVYNLPTNEVSKSNIGLNDEDIESFNIEVKITKLDSKIVDIYDKVIKSKGAELVFPPVSFEIIGNVVNKDGTNEVIKINKFDTYVERVMEIPNGVNPKKITTGVVFNPDGTYSSVPTVVYFENGKWYAKLSSLTNSNYSVIYNNLVVTSAQGNWAMDVINTLANRLIIENIDTFDPSEDITRGMFADYMVKALGLYRNDYKFVNKFTDLEEDNSLIEIIHIAHDYGIITGYEDKTFRANNKITREEAMVMYSRAMNIVGLRGENQDKYMNFTDFELVGNWAKQGTINVLSAGVFNGKTKELIDPRGKLTYAEASQAIYNLLINSGLINN
jgi:uncharacterized repeat protein (TIGR02543 family)